jgi:pimeloyl-ACP methyl ester carboxylesterase
MSIQQEESISHEHRIVVRGVTLHVREVGDPSAPPLLFLHGIMGHRHDWDVLIDLVATRCRVVVPDQRGHGRSAWADSYRVADMADDAISLINTLELGPLPVVGHSMGAMVGLLMAAHRPDLVERLVAIDIVPDSLATDFGAQMPAMFEAMAAASYASVDEAVAEWQTGNPLAQPALLRNYVAHALVTGPDGRLRWGFDAIGLRDFATAGVSPAELWAAIDQVRCPTLLVRGEHSPITTAEQVADVADRLRDSRVVTISGGGHDLGVEQPAAVAHAVLAFLSPPGAELGGTEPVSVQERTA